VLGGALLKPGRRGRRAALKEKSKDIVTLVVGVALMLVWAGIVESFFSQYHWPVLPYWLKISFGTAQTALLIYYLGFCGRSPEEKNKLGSTTVIPGR
jgi:hypothetical protein